jgi:hypothetical protein
MPMRRVGRRHEQRRFRWGSSWIIGVWSPPFDVTTSIFIFIFHAGAAGLIQALLHARTSAPLRC